MVEHIVRNNWMHLNVTWNSAWLERVFVTPRYHHPSQQRSSPSDENLGALLTIWDRLFGTYYDPDQIQRPLSFGLNRTSRPCQADDRRVEGALFKALHRVRYPENF